MIDTTVMFSLLSVMFILGLIFYRTGLIGGGLVAGTFIILMMTGLAQGWISELFLTLAQSFDMGFFYQLFAGAIILYTLSWLFIRRITTIHAK